MIGPLSAESILWVWEVGADRGPVDRALALLAAGADTAHDLADLPLALRDKRLLDLRAKTFGDALNCVTTCPNCQEILELELSSEALGSALPAPKTDNITIAGREFQLRPLNSRDLAEVSRCRNMDEATAILRKNICGCSSSDIPEQSAQELDLYINAQESRSEIGLSLTCAGCKHTWRESLDIAGYFWTELESLALRLLGDIAEIARCFSWSEKEILNLSPHRRRAYLALARGA